MEITEQMKNEVLERSGRRCECVSKNCRHHRPATRCPKGLRTEGWKVYYRTASAGANLWNLEAWCFQCFENNYG